MFLRTRKSKRRYALLAAFLLAWTFLLACWYSSTTSPDSASSSPPAETNPKPKVFVIGLSKTGTTSVGDALALLDYRRLGWEDIRSRLLFRAYISGDVSPLAKLTTRFDAFEDLPWALVYREMATLYPDARFILTLRKEEGDWLRSIKEHTGRRRWIGHEFVYGAARAEGNDEMYLHAYRNHTETVREFFAVEGKGRLLEFVIDGWGTEDEDEDEDELMEVDGEIWGVLLRFLGMEDSEEVREEMGEFPWSNRSDDWVDRDFMRGVWWFWDEIMYYLEGVLLGTLQCLGWLTGRKI